MLVLFETPAGYAVFKVSTSASLIMIYRECSQMLDEKKLKDVDNVFEHFSTASKAAKAVELVAFKKFKSTAEAVEGTNSVIEGKVSVRSIGEHESTVVRCDEDYGSHLQLNKTLKKLLKSKVDSTEKLAVGDAKLGAIIKVR